MLPYNVSEDSLDAVFAEEEIEPFVEPKLPNKKLSQRRLKSKRRSGVKKNVDAIAPTVAVSENVESIATLPKEVPAVELTPTQPAGAPPKRRSRNRYKGQNKQTAATKTPTKEVSKENPSLLKELWKKILE
jgi:hypothetical protein